MPTAGASRGSWVEHRAACWEASLLFPIIFLVFWAHKSPNLLGARGAVAGPSPNTQTSQAGGVFQSNCEVRAVRLRGKR